MAKEKFDDSVLKRLATNSYNEAANRNDEYVTVEHLLKSLINEEDIKELFTQLSINIDLVDEQTEAYLREGPIPKTNKKPVQTTKFKSVLNESANMSVLLGKETITGIDVILIILKETECAACYILNDCGLTTASMKEIVIEGVSSDSAKNKLATILFGESGDTQERPSGGELSFKKADKIINTFLTNLNEEAKKGKIDNLIGRRKEILDMSQIMVKRLKNNIVLLGNPGTGKTGLVEGFAKLINDGEVPEALKNAVIYGMDVGNIVSGTRFRGDFEERLKLILSSLNVVAEEKKINPILFIDEIHMILGAGSGSENKNFDMANLLKPYLSKGKLKVIGATTFEEFRKYFEKDKALTRRFQRYDFEEPSESEAIEILKGLKKYYEDHHKLTYTVEALEAAVTLSVKYIQNRFLPDKALDIIDSVGAKQNIVPVEQRKSVITLEEIEEEIAKVAKVSLEVTKHQDKKESLKNLDIELKSEIYGQDNAIDEITNAIYVAKTGLRDKNKPQAVFLFTGPTGSGKTELTKKLAEKLNIHMERIDMSEFADKHTATKFIGSPPSYVGYDDSDGRLIEVLEKYPTSLILLDEVEKAHPSIMNIFLQIYDNGIITSSKGKSVSAKNAIFIMTSNAGARDAQKGTIGFNAKEYDTFKQDDALKDFFAPEFLNRIDAIVKFNSLSEENVYLIIDKFIKELNMQLFDKKITVKLTDAAKKFIYDTGYDQVYGARPIARAIHKHIKVKLSHDIINEKINDNDHIMVDCVDSNITLTKVEVSEYA